MLFAQVAEAEKVFQETAKTFSLAVAILIFLVFALGAVLYFIVRTMVAWFKPLVIAFFDSHQKTMMCVQDASAKQLEATSAQVKLMKTVLDEQKQVAQRLEEFNASQGEKLDLINQSTQETNTLLEANGKVMEQNGKCNSVSLHELVDAIKKGRET